MMSGRSGLIAALDIGTSKICCLIAQASGRAESGEGIRILGIGQQAARGMRGGAIVDMEAAERSIRGAVDAAEKMAGITVRRVLACLAGGQPKSRATSTEIGISGQPIGEHDLRRLLHQARARSRPHDGEVLHAIPTGYSIDGCGGIHDPRGLYGDRLGVEMHLVVAAPGPLRNLALCIERCDLELAGIVAAPLASGLACLVDDEMELGTTCIDMGGGTTSIGVFYGGHLVHADAVAIGGAHVTSDIARGLSTPLQNAERLKTLYGSAIPSPADEREMLDVPQIGEDPRDGPNHVPRSMLTGIIQPRIEETLEFVRDRLRAVGVAPIAGRRAVLTGGAAQLTGVRELASRILNQQVRIGRPMLLSGLPTRMGGSALSAAVGLLIYAARGPIEAVETDGAGEIAVLAGQGPLARIGQWLKTNL